MELVCDGFEICKNQGEYLPELFLFKASYYTLFPLMHTLGLKNFFTSTCELNKGSVSGKGEKVHQGNINLSSKGCKLGHVLGKIFLQLHPPPLLDTSFTKKLWNDSRTCTRGRPGLDPVLPPVHAS
jgi:hypothetical protein